MVFRSKLLIFISIGALGVNYITQAAEWSTVRSSSSVTFVATQEGSQFQGLFETFSAEVDFDTTDPSSGQIIGIVEPASVNSGDAERDATLLDRDWFDPNNYPESKFESERIEEMEDGSYRAHAQLTLRGITNPVVMDFTFESSEINRGNLSGTVKINRLDFGVGQGFWADTSWVANEVNVRVNLSLEQ